MKDQIGDIDYGYDELGRLSLVNRKGCPAVTYTYDSLDRIAGIRIGDFYELGYTYDFLGRIETLETPAGVISYEYLTGQGGPDPKTL